MFSNLTTSLAADAHRSDRKLSCTRNPLWAAQHVALRLRLTRRTKGYCSAAARAEEMFLIIVL
jgi:hypothetical protein